MGDSKLEKLVGRHQEAQGWCLMSLVPDTGLGMMGQGSIDWSTLLQRPLRKHRGVLFPHI